MALFDRMSPSSYTFLPLPSPHLLYNFSPAVDLGEFIVKPPGPLRLRVLVWVIGNIGNIYIA